MGLSQSVFLHRATTKQRNKPEEFSPVSCLQGIPRAMETLQTFPSVSPRLHLMHPAQGCGGGSQQAVTTLPRAGLTPQAARLAGEQSWTGHPEF